MKKLFFSLVLCACAFISFSQDYQFQSGREKYDSKPQLFQNVAQKFAVKTNLIDDIMNVTAKETVILPVTDGFSFKGTVSSKSTESQGLTTVTIQSSEINDLFFTLSKVVMPDQSVVYRGMIVSKSHSDVLVLDKDPVTGNYNWNKMKLSMLIPD